MGNGQTKSTVRIVILGKTGVGKSASGNTILGKQSFKSEFSPTSLTQHCEKDECEVAGQKVVVIDTPCLFDTRNTEETTIQDISQSIAYASPGPHIFLIVIRLGRFTEEEKQMKQKIQEIFGEEADKYSMVLFTHGDKLKGKSIEEFLKDSKDLQELVDKCNGQYHVINNKGRFQRNKLLGKIRNINVQNGESYYTTEMFQKAARAIEEEKQRILKEKEEEKHKEQEELRKEIEAKYQQQSTPPAAFNNDESIRIVMVGKTGAGKSSSGNTILGKQHFKSELSPKSVTQHCEKTYGKVDGQWVAVIDTPGLFYTEEETDKDIVQCITYASPGPHIFLIIIRLGRFTEEEKQTVQKIQDTFGEEADKYSMVLFTHGDRLKGKPIKEFLKDNKDLKELVAKCNGQYHMFNNEVEDRSQVSELLKKIRNIKEKNGGSFDTTTLLQKTENVIREEKQQILKDRKEQNRKEQEKDQRRWSEVHPDSSASRSTPLTVYNNGELIRIVMVGKTGAGKSASGNTILGEECFKSKFSAKSMTIDCKKADGEVAGQKVAVIDTPGLFDTKNTGEKTHEDLIQCISYASPGPHIFLVVIRLGRFTEEEKQTVQKIQKIFGEEANKYSMVLFTHGDLLKGKSIEEFLKNSKDLQELVAKCHGQYHVFNNEEEDRSQVSELLKKIKNINKQNGATYYNTEMFQKAERKIEEEKQRILKEKEVQHRKEQEDLRKEIEEKYERQMREERADKERKNQLRDAREKEMEEEMKKLQQQQEELARKLAEKRKSVIYQLGAALGKLCHGFIDAFIKS